MFKFAKFAKLAAVSLALLGGAAQAEDWAPKGSLTIQVAFAAGGSTDVLARVVGKAMEEQTGWNVIVENKPGAGGVAMFTGISKRPADGTVIGVGVNMPIMVQLVNRGDQIPFDLDSFDYIGTISRAQNALIANADSPYGSLDEMIAYSKTNGPLNIGFDAGPQKLIMEMIARRSGAQFNMVSTKGGSEMLKLMLGGQLDMGFGAGGHHAQLEAGNIKLLAALTSTPLTYAPEIPTVVDAGYDVFLDPYYYVATGAGTPDDARKALVAALENAVKDPEVMKLVENTAKNPALNLGPEGTRAMLDDGMKNVHTLFDK